MSAISTSHRSELPAPRIFADAPARPRDARTVVDLLRMRALRQPDRVAYTFLADGEREEGSVTYAGLDARARAVAARLVEAGAAGERALLVHAPGLEYVASFLGCLYAGTTAVPVYPPRPNKPNPRLLGIVADARPAVALTSAEGVAQGEALAAAVPGLGAMRWLEAGGTDEGADAWTPPAATGETIAFLQYTSGSTSAPKGVRVSHANLLHNFAVIEHFCGYSEESRSVIWLPPYHDMGLIGGILQPLFSGYPVALMSPAAFLQRPMRWLEAIGRYRATTSGGPNFAYELCAQKATPGEIAALDLSAWTVAFNGAEPVRADTLERFVRAFAPAGFRRGAFLPCYGLAEATLMSTSADHGAEPRVVQVDADALARGRAELVSVDADASAGTGEETTRTLVSSGGCAPGQVLRIVDPETRAACEEGRVGEVWIQGPSVAMGYWRRPEATEEAFGGIIAGSGEGPFLRTGDLGFVDGGELYVTGRIKDLVIIRGRNHYPQDLELAAERGHAALRPGNGAAFGVEAEGEERLAIVYEVRREEMRADVEEVAAAVRAAIARGEGLEVHAVALVRPGGILKTSSGKIQRRACRAAFLKGELPLVGVSILGASTPAAAEAEPEDEMPIRARLAAARSADRPALLEAHLRRRLAALLRVDPAGLDPTAALVTLGLDSLRAAELKGALEAELEVEVPVTALLEDGGTAGLARLLLERMALPDPPEPPAPDPSAGGPPAGGPLSFAQEALWFLDQLQPGSAAYNIALELALEGELDADALRRAVALLVRRQDALRTVFPAPGGRPAQVVLPLAEPAIPLDDLSSLPLEAREEEAGRRARAEAGAPFDLAGGPLVRFRLLRLDARRHRLVVVMHHAVGDGASAGVIVRELAEAYRAYAAGAEPSPAALPFTFADHAAREREALTAEALRPLLEHWRARLAEVTPLELHPALPRPARPGTAGALHRFEVPAPVAEALRALARREGVTPFVALLAGFSVLLARHAGRDDVVVGTPVANRGAPGAAALVGYFVNPLPLRADLAGRPSFRTLLARLRRTTLDALGHAALPFDRLVEELHPRRDAAVNPLFQVMFSLQGVPLETVRLPGLTLTPSLLDTGAARLDLTLQMGEREEGGWWAAFEYATDRFSADTVADFAARFVRVLAGAALNPEAPVHALPLLDGAGHAALLSAAEGADAPWADELLHAGFEARAARTPDAAALFFGTGRVTYAELDARADVLARGLRALGVGPETRVGVCLERGPGMVAALLAVLRAGGAYVPLDPRYPAERVALMLEDSGARVVLAERATLSAVPPTSARVVAVDETLPVGEDAGAEDVHPPVRPENLAYLVYTSGSTGRPKAVAVEHRSAAVFVRWALGEFSAEELAGVLASTSICFDLSVFELFVPLWAGGAVVLAHDALALPTLPARDRVTLLNTVPSAAEALLAAGALPPSVRTVNLAGEPLRRALADGLYALGHVRRVLNLYGPSEDTTYSTWARVPAGAPGAPSIGRALAGTRAYLLDGAGQLAPPGVPGELYLGGRGLARGYLGRPALTAERFVPDAFSGAPGARLYRTGDRAVAGADGALAFQGRLDHQVKVRGFRVEPGEVEAALLALGVEDCAVVARQDAAGGAMLAAYVVGGALAPDALADALRGRLPAPLVPSAFVVLPALPRTPNGKLDRKALPAPEVDAAGGYVPPREGAEAALAAVWAELLGVERVGARDDFFALGGHSLLAARAAVRAREALGVEVPLRALFESPTPEALARRLADAAAPAEASAPLARVARGGPLAVSFAQERLWLLDRLEPGSAAYNMPGGLRLRGELDEAALERALGEVVARHDVLRTRFAEVDGRPAQVVAPWGGFALKCADLRGLPDGEVDEVAATLAETEAARPFHLARGPLVRARLVRLREAEWLLLVTLHHAVADGGSLEVLLRELAALYPAFRDGRPSPLAPLSHQYADYAAWQRAALAGGAPADSHLAWWRARLAGLAPAPALPTDRPRPAVAGAAQGRHAFVLDAAAARGARALARGEGATPFMVALAAFSALLGRWAGTEDLAVGTPVDVRPGRETEGMIGVFVNTLVLRVDLSGRPSARALVRRARDTVLEARARAELPFERVVEALGVERSLAHTPLFQVMMTLRPAGSLRLALPGLEAEVVETGTAAAKFDLSLGLVEEEDGGLRGTLAYRADLFDAATAERMAARLGRLLAGMGEAPDAPVAELPLFADGEREMLLGAWNDPGGPFAADRCAHAVIAGHAARAPAAPAVEHPGGTLSFAELEDRAGRLARRLRARGVGAEDRVGICLERGVDTLVSVLAAWKAGGAFVPMDPALPIDRLRYLAEDSGARIVIAREGIADGLDLPVLRMDEEGGEEAADATSSIDPDPATLAYVLYTSGSTGRPKGVMVEHRGVAAYLGWAARTLLAEGVALPTVTSLSFDASLKQLLAPLFAGRAAWLPEVDAARPDALLSALASRPAVAMNCVPSLWSAMLDALERGEGPRPGGLRRLMLGGESVDPALLRRTLGHFPGVEVWNLYGPTEATANASAARLDGAERVTIGFPVANGRAYMVDGTTALLPVGVPGELCVGGMGVARGYLGRPALTAERFVPDPFAAEPGARMYRTGDRARRVEGGALEHLGRLDRQLKVRGVRVEPGEIEAALRAHPSVRDAVVAARTDARGEASLVAYVEGDAAASTLREHLRGRVAAVAVPARFVVLPALPRTPGGKVDPAALPAPADEAVEYAAPRGEAQRALAAVWAEVLGRDPVGAHDDFFALGGHSLVAARVVARVREALGVELPLRALFETPTVAGLAARVEAIRAAAPPHADDARPADDAIVAETDRASLPLSFAQRRLWVLDRLDPGSPAYHMPAALRLRGPLDVRALRRALSLVVARHEVLRTSYPALDGGEPSLAVAAPAPIDLPEIDLRGMEPAERAAEAERRAVEEARRPFDLARGPVLRATLLRLDAEESLLLVTLHHVAGDGASVGVLVREVSRAYRAFSAGRQPELPAPPVRYADFAAWQRRRLSGPAMEAAVEAARARLAGAPTVLALPADHPRAEGRAPAGYLPFALSAEAARAARGLARSGRATPFMALLAGFAALLGRWAGTDDLLVGVPASGRPRRELEGVVGCFVNTLVVRADLSGAPTGAGWLRRVRREVLAAQAGAEVPFERLVDALGVERGPAHAPLVQAMLSLDEPRPHADLGAVRATVEETPTGAAKMDLVVRMTDDGAELRGVAEYRADLWDEGTIRRMTAQLDRLLQAMAADPARPVHDLPLLDDEERRAVLYGWNPRPAAPAPTRSLAALFAEQAARTPHARAVTFGGESLTYAELGAHAGRLARRLARAGVRPGDRVALLLERSWEMVVAVVGTLMAGAAYVPVDPGYPADRIAYVLDDSGARLVLAQGSLAGHLAGRDIPVMRVDPDAEPEAREPAPLLVDVDPAAPAYVIYTSGSTGRPKGVAVTHANVHRLFTATDPWFGFGADDVWTLFHSYAFDFSVWEIWGALLYGGRLVVVPFELSRTPEAFRRLLADEGVTVLNQTPSAFRQLIAADEAAADAGPTALRYVIFGGEALEPATLRPWVRRRGDAAPRLVNMYGITETTVHVTYRPIGRAEVEGGAASVIGAAIPDLRLYVLDPRGHPQPVGVPGELYVGGEGLSDGYLGRPSLTARRFVPDLFSGRPGARLYRSGDLARWVPAGELEYLGRIDTQVKVRGFRIELGEIEAALLAHPSVREAAAVVRQDAPGEGRIVGYVVPPAGTGVETAALRAHLRGRLPEYMVPSRLVALDAFPLTPNGKLDRRALPAPPAEAEGGGWVAPRTPTEALLAGIWAEVLRRERVGVHDDFFAAGGDSILSIQAVARARRAGLALTPGDLFRTPTVAALAAAADAAGPPPAPAAPSNGHAPDAGFAAELSAGELDALARLLGDA